MAILRTELHGSGVLTQLKAENESPAAVTVGVFDAIAETEADLAAPRTAAFAPGSMVYCIQEESLHIKTTAGLWEEVCL